jgi:DNA-binding NarL/FixJ family response regulator
MTRWRYAQVFSSDESHMSDSIFSHGEQAIASMIKDGMTLEEIAEERDVSTDTIEQSIDRIREKTTRAVTTLAESPFTAEVGADLDEEAREKLLDALEE